MKFEVNLSEYGERLRSLGRVVWRMESRGVPVDLEVCREISAKARADAAESLAWLNGYVGAYTGRVLTHETDKGSKAGYNWNYADWLVEVLHGGPGRGLGIRPSKFGAKGEVRDGKITTDATALEWLAATTPEHREFLNRIRAFRRQERMAGYADSWIALAVLHPDGTYRLHPSFGMANDADDRPGARTGRFGLKNPPLQQVPKDKRKDPYRLRRAFVAPPGYVLVVADYSQLEVVILAHLFVRLFGDRSLADRLTPESPDLHSATAKFVFGDTLGNVLMRDMPVGDVKEDPEGGVFRDQIKRVRYGLNYRKGPWGFGNTLFELDNRGEIVGPPLGEERAQVLIDALYRFDPGIPAFHRWVDDYIAENLVMPSLLGRWFPFPDARSSERWRVRRAQRQATNWPMQSGGQEITAAAMIELDRLGFEMTLQVHDELHFLVREDDVARDEPLIRNAMENAVPLDAPLIAKPAHGRNWEEGKGK